jgi:hypothetical protein
MLHFTSMISSQDLVTTTKQLEHKKSVRFATTNQINDIITRNDYSTEETKACWWTTKENKARHQRLRLMLDKAVTKSTYNIITAICDMQESVVKSSLQESCIKPNDIPTKFLVPFSRWTSYCKGLRGLERHIALFAAAHTCDSWSSYHRSEEAAAIRDQVLLMQEERSYSDEDLASRYRELSNRACLYAYCAGCGDAHVSAH